MVKKPPHLEKGDTIGLVAPSGTFNRNQLRLGMKRLARMGFDTIVGKAAYSRKSFSAGNERLKAFDIVDMFEGEPAAVMCIAGGMNASHVIPHLDFRAIKRHPKPFIGYSDNSVLANAINSATGIVTFHGPMALGNMKGATRDYFMRTLTLPEPTGALPKGWKVLRGGSCRGRIFGGNLTSISAIVGTRYDPNWKGNVLFWEEISESPSIISSMLIRFRLAGIFDRLGGMVIGKLKNCDYKKKNDLYGTNVNEIVLSMTQRYDFPIITDFPAGHFDTNITLPLGCRVSIDTRSKAFSVEESAVS